MTDRAQHGPHHREEAEGPQHRLPEPDSDGDMRIAGEPIPFGLVAMREDGDDAGAADALRIVQRRLGISIRPQLRDAREAQADHIVLGTKVQAAGGARLDAGGLERDLDPVHAQRALRHLARLDVILRDIERAAGLAQLAADASLRVHVHDPVLILNDGAGSGAGLEAPRVLAVHALVLAHQPRHRVAQRALVEADQVPEVGLGLRHRLVRADLPGLDHLEVIPFLAGHLARFAADTRRGIDELGDDGDLADAGPASPEGSRGPADLEALGGHYAFSSLTRNVLNSGVQVLPSMAEGVRKFASGPI